MLLSYHLLRHVFFIYVHIISTTLFCYQLNKACHDFQSIQYLRPIFINLVILISLSCCSCFLMLFNFVPIGLSVSIILIRTTRFVCVVVLLLDKLYLHWTIEQSCTPIIFYKNTPPDLHSTAFYYNADTGASSYNYSRCVISVL